MVYEVWGDVSLLSEKISPRINQVLVNWWLKIALLLWKLLLFLKDFNSVIFLLNLTSHIGITPNKVFFKNSFSSWQLERLKAITWIKSYCWEITFQILVLEKVGEKRIFCGSLDSLAIERRVVTLFNFVTFSSSLKYLFLNFSSSKHSNLQ